MAASNTERCQGTPTLINHFGPFPQPFYILAHRMPLRSGYTTWGQPSSHLRERTEFKSGWYRKSAQQATFFQASQI